VYKLPVDSLHRNFHFNNELILSLKVSNSSCFQFYDEFMIIMIKSRIGIKATSDLIFYDEFKFVIEEVMFYDKN